MGSRQRRSPPSHHAILLAAAVLSGCALQPPAAPDACDRAFARLQSATAAVRDAQYHPLAGFPGLRSDRVLAVLAVEATSPAARRLWLQRLADNDREAAAIERGNLAAGERADLPDPALLEGCRRR